MTEKMLEETLTWIREQGIATDKDRLSKIYDRVRSQHGLTRYEASELVLKVLDRME